MFLPPTGGAGQAGGNRQPPLSEAGGNIVLFPLCVFMSLFKIESSYFLLLDSIK